MNLDDLTVDLESDMRASPEFVELMADNEFCAELWTALANTEWRKVVFANLTDEEQIYLRLTLGDSRLMWSGSFRYNGGLIANIRNSFHGTYEDYMDWYCRTVEGKPYSWVSPRVMEAIKRLGWVPVEDIYFLEANK